VISASPYGATAGQSQEVGSPSSPDANSPLLSEIQIASNNKTMLALQRRRIMMRSFLVAGSAFFLLVFILSSSFLIFTFREHISQDVVPFVTLVDILCAFSIYGAYLEYFRLAQLLDQLCQLLLRVNTEVLLAEESLQGNAKRRNKAGRRV
jgi:hypothetical protein